MSETNEQKRNPRQRAHNFEEAKRLVPERLRNEFASHTKEEMAERLTAYEPGIPHTWFGRPVEPITKEELLAYWNGGPEPEIRYKDVPQSEPAESRSKP